VNEVGFEPGVKERKGVMDVESRESEKEQVTGKGISES